MLSEGAPLALFRHEIYSHVRRDPHAAHVRDMGTQTCRSHFSMPPRPRPSSPSHRRLRIDTSI